VNIMAVQDPSRDRPAPRAGEPPDVQARVNATLAALDARQDQWAQAVRQDAVEAVARLPWMQKVRDGVRVPVHDMYMVPLKRVATRMTRAFVDDTAPEVAAFLGGSAAELVLAGKGAMSEMPLQQGDGDLVLKRGFTEGELAFRLRFEREVHDHVAATYQGTLRAHLGRELEAVTRAWARHARQDG
jgi:hypothetical protein